MHCPSCDRDSNNRRVCPHCFTPYPADDGASSLRRNPTPLSQPTQGIASTGAGISAGVRAGTGAAAGARARAGGGGSALAWSSLSPTVRWTGLGIALVLLVWLFLPSDPVGGDSGASGRTVGAPTRPTVSLIQAQALLRQTRETALVESQSDEVFVSYRAATFPLKDEGQLALAARYAEADQVVQGRRRRIYFYNPNGRVFAQSDPVKGIVVP